MREVSAFGPFKGKTMAEVAESLGNCDPAPARDLKNGYTHTWSRPGYELVLHFGRADGKVMKAESRLGGPPSRGLKARMAELAERGQTIADRLLADPPTREALLREVEAYCDFDSIADPAEGMWGFGPELDASWSYRFRDFRVKNISSWEAIRVSDGLLEVSLAIEGMVSFAEPGLIGRRVDRRATANVVTCIDLGQMEQEPDSLALESLTAMSLHPAASSAE
jgi:hypothetical protein